MNRPVPTNEASSRCGTPALRVSMGRPAVACALCGGAGHSLRTNGVAVACEACEGQGWVWLREPVWVCVHCFGKGDHPPRSGLACLVCGGVGALEAPEGVVPCPDCRGTGRLEWEDGSAAGERLCTRCCGTGLIDRLEVLDG